MFLVHRQPGRGVICFQGQEVWPPNAYGNKIMGAKTIGIAYLPYYYAALRPCHLLQKWPSLFKIDKMNKP